MGGVGGGALGFDDLDAVIVGVSALSPAELRSKLVDPYLLTLPFLADTRKELAEAFGAKNPLGDTFRQTFVIDPKGTILFIERNIQMGVGSEPLSPALARSRLCFMALLSPRPPPCHPYPNYPGRASHAQLTAYALATRLLVVPSPPRRLQPGQPSGADAEESSISCATATGGRSERCKLIGGASVLSPNGAEIQEMRPSLIRLTAESAVPSRQSVCCRLSQSNANPEPVCNVLTLVRYLLSAPSRQEFSRPTVSIKEP